MTLIKLDDIDHSVDARKERSIPDLADAYASISSSVTVRFIFDRVTYTAPVNFTDASLTPRHRWFPYKEGFSPTFVQQFLNQFLGSSFHGVVFDPFSGVGTTAIEAARLGYDAVGMDVSPLAIFIAQAKALTVSETELQLIKNESPHPERSDDRGKRSVFSRLNRFYSC